MSTKARYNASIVLVIAILCTSILTILYFVSGPTSTYDQHFEKRMSDSERVHLIIMGLQDCTVTLEYEENEDLMYRIGAVLYNSSDTISVEYNYGIMAEHQVNINPGTTTRAKNVDITLGIGHPYYILMGAWNDNSRNVTCNIAFTNQATLGSQVFTYFMPGSLNLDFSDNVDFSQGGLEIRVGSYNFHVESVQMNVDLPDGMDGDVTFNSESISISALGWTLYQETSFPPTSSYRTSSNSSKPLLYIDYMYAESIQATLQS